MYVSFLLIGANSALLRISKVVGATIPSEAKLRWSIEFYSTIRTAIAHVVVEPTTTSIFYYLVRYLALHRQLASVLAITIAIATLGPVRTVQFCLVCVG